ncbi:hypothetical protein GCM10018785_57550 [Streptomyces longispororuber]|uniref:Secreted protein n=1 Tax=Streptomyces longispororuber TaxID=68230 RepID=A0A919DUY0_9ACTN|nr:hypothetical protein [Streptomyces longispororuber]GHE81970.1 hypothetical protein GCM10018785_57550 [Streptomyces longispororuber]
MSHRSWGKRVTTKTVTVTSVGLLAAAVLGGTATAAPQGPNGTSAETAPASAAPAVLAERGDVCFSGACGSATFSWSGAYRLSNVSMSVKDNKCDDNDVYIRLRIYDGSSNSGWATKKRRNSSGCSASPVSWHGLSVSNDARILGVKVEACVDDAGRDTCRKSPYIAR